MQVWQGGSMKNFIFLFIFCLSLGQVTFSEEPEYWLIQQESIRMGKRELYESQKQEYLKKQVDSFKKQKTSFSVFGVEDLENPRYVFLMPLKKLDSLGLYPPIAQGEKNPLLDTCIHFQISSLHELLKECSLRPNETFVESRPYYIYILYDIDPGSEKIFEQQLSIASSKQVDASLSWCAWKSLLAGDCPMYLLCFSFETKEKMKEWPMEKFLDKASLKEIFRGEKSGWMKRSSSLSF